MFNQCKALTAAPALPATTLAENCYGSMFSVCTALTTAPALPATTLANACYQGMFLACSNLTAAPALPATTLTTSCYANMFNKCKALTTPPELPATALAVNCYRTMFSLCSSLKVSETQVGDYTKKWRIPTTGSIETTPNDWNTYMLSSTGGTFTGPPTENTTYYLYVAPALALNENMVTATNQTYDGTAKTPVIVKNDDTVLTAGTDYTITYTNNTAAGTASYTVTGTGNYTGSITGSFTIAKCTATLSWADTNLTYTGTAQAPTATVTNLVGSDTCTVTVTGSQTNVGSYTATATALSNANYARPTAVTKDFAIGKKSITPTVSQPADVDYTGAKFTPTVTVKDDTTDLAASDYTVTYGANTNPGTATVTVTATEDGNYSFTAVTKSFAINKVTYTGTTTAGATYTCAATGRKTLDLAGLNLPTGYVLGVPVVGATGINGADVTGTELTYTLAGTATAGTTATVTVPVTNSDIYTPFNIVLTVSFTDKTVTGITGVTAATGLVYNAAAQTGTTGTPAYSAGYTGDDLTTTYYAGANATGTPLTGAPTAAGDYTVVYAVPAANEQYAGSTTLHFTIAPIALTWDVSGLTAQKPYDGTTTATVTGTLKVSGALGNDDVQFAYPVQSLAGSYDSATVGSGKTVTVTVTGAVVGNANYTLPTGDIKITTGRIAAPLPNPPQTAPDSGVLKLTVDPGIPMVPDALKNDPTRDTPAKIEAAMQAEAAKRLPGVPAANIITMDIELWYSNNGGVNWTVATQDKFPAAGVTVVVPYGDLNLTYAAAQGMDFTVTHMISMGDKAGTIENPDYTLTQAGVQFTLNSLSPVTIAYTGKAAVTPPTSPAVDNTEDTTPAPAATPAPTAVPAPGKFTVNAWVNVLAGGVVSPMGNTTCTEGQNLTYTITPATGYRIAKVTVDGVDVGAVTSYTFKGLNRNHQIGAYFEKTTTATAGTIPATGDTAPLLLWAALMALAAMGLAAAYAMRKKNHR